MVSCMERIENRAHGWTESTCMSDRARRRDALSMTFRIVIGCMPRVVTADRLQVIEAGSPGVMGLKKKVHPADASPGRRALQKRKEAIAPSSVIAASVKAEDVAELARAVCRVALLVESSQDIISISHTLWVITRGVSHSSRTP